MGRPKVKIIDDSLPVEELKKEAPKKVANKDDLVAKINAELGIESTSENSERLRESDKSEAQKTRKSDKQELRSPDRSDNPSPSESFQKKPSSTIHHPSSKAKPRSKKYQESIKDFDKSRTYSLNEAVDLVKKLSYSKFDGTLEAHINTAASGIRGLVSLPFASGKKLRILVFGKSAGESGADKIGDEAVIEEIGKGKIDFDLVITTPDWMPKLAKIAKNLGPRGLMPNPKNGTITNDLKKAVESFQAGKTEYKTESKIPVMHMNMGKLSQPTEELSSNIKTLMQTLGKTKVKKITLSPTMGPGVKVNLSSI